MIGTENVGDFAKRETALCVKCQMKTHGDWCMGDCPIPGTPDYRPPMILTEEAVVAMEGGALSSARVAYGFMDVEGCCDAAELSIAMPVMHAPVASRLYTQSEMDTSVNDAFKNGFETAIEKMQDLLASAIG